MGKKLIFLAYPRVFLYAALVAVSAFIIRSDASSVALQGIKFGESSFTEWMQQVYLLLTSSAFLISGALSSEHKAISYLMGGGALVALIREFDFYFDKIYHGAWFPLAMVVLLMSLFLVYRKRKQIWNNLDSFFSSPAFGVFIAGFLGVFVFSRLFGTKRLWMALFEVERLEPMQRWVKNAVEEGSELFGYTLLFISAVEFLLYVIEKKEQQKHETSTARH